MTKSCGIPFSRHIASAHDVIFIADPERWIVAQSGMVNPAILSDTPFLRVCASVTGIVAADDDVPSAVMYAGSMFQSSFSGLRPTSRPATQNW